MTKAQIKEWAHFYVELIVASMVNGVWLFGKAVLGGLTVNQLGLVDLKSISLHGFGWLFLGTVASNVVAALAMNLLPLPKAPANPAP